VAILLRLVTIGGPLTISDGFRVLLIRALFNRVGKVWA